MTAQPDEARLQAAVEALGRGELVVYPTDTLYALGADALDLRAIERLYNAKQRPAAQPVSVAVASVGHIERVARLGPMARRVAERFLPGPLTLVLPPDPGIPEELLGDGRGLGVRVPAHPVAQALAQRFGPLTCTSANLHGRPDARTAEEARQQLGASAAVVLDAGPARGQPSTVLDLTGPRPRIARDGALPRQELEAWLSMSMSP